jgi:hypothetical protein
MERIDINEIPSMIVRLSTELYINMEKLESINLVYSASNAMDLCKMKANELEKK